LGEALERASLADPARHLFKGLALLPDWLEDKGWVSLIALAAAPQSPEFLAYGACLQKQGAVLVEEEEAKEPPEELPDLSFFSAQGEEVETEEALERIRVLLDEGVRPDRIALGFASGEPYLRLIEERADGIGFPLRPTKGMSFRLTARGRAGRNWIRFVLLDAPSALRTPLLFEPRLSSAGSPAAAALDRKAREEGWLGGVEELQALLLSLEERPRGFSELKAFLQTTIQLRAKLLDSSNTSEHCRLLAEAMHKEGLLESKDSDPFSQVLRALPQVKRLLPPQHPSFSLEELAQLFESLLEEISLPLPQTHKEGIRVLPLQRMGVLEFDHVFLLGCLRGSWPMNSRPNPWLSQKDYEHLGSCFVESFGNLNTRSVLPPCPCPPNREQEIERQRLRLLLKHCKQSLCLSYPGTDLRAKPRSPSPWLEELRTAKGDTHSLPLLSAELQRRLSRREAEDYGLSELEAMTLAGFERREEALRFFGRRSLMVPSRSGDFVAERDRFSPRQRPSPFDALGLGPSLPLGQPLSVTAFEDLGSCPLRFFFRHVLGLCPLPAEPSLDLVSALDRGSAVHRILQKVFETLLAQGLFEEDSLPLETCLDIGVQEISRLLRAEADRLMSRQFLRFPRLRQEVITLWGKSLEAQFRLDLEELKETGARPVSLEKKLLGALIFQKLRGETKDSEEEQKHETRPLLLRGKYDRLDQLPGGRYRILDYKTGSSAKKLNRKDILQGRKTQLYLYQRLFLEGDDQCSKKGNQHPMAALRGVGPNFPIQEASRLPEAMLDEDFWENPIKGDLEDSLATLLSLIDEGNFPFEAKTGPCRHCEFTEACPRHHSPTRNRMEHEPRAEEFRNLQTKTISRRKQGSRGKK
jgi:RecB family exonuclease